MKITESVEGLFTSFGTHNQFWILYEKKLQFEFFFSIRLCYTYIHFELVYFPRNLYQQGTITKRNFRPK